MSIRISAVICTHNRADYLRQAIQSLVSQTLPKELYEILVLDNGSTDNTHQVAEGFSTVPNLRYIYVPILGLSHARNVGWREAEGEYVAYLDDDAEASPRWLERMLEAFQTVKPRPGCVGGKIEPVWEATRPAWLADKLVPSLAVIDWSDIPTVLEKSQWLAGANIAFPRDLLELFSGFSTEIGRKGKSLVSMGEILLQDRVRNEGHTCFYDPEISVEHHIQAQRLTKKWFRRRAYWQGVSQAAVLMLQQSSSTGGRFRAFVRATGGLLVHPGRLVNLILPTSDPARFAQQYGTLLRIGYIVGILGLAT